jgi:hypothetical protein
MDKDRDLLPWIFGGLSMVSVALAVTIGSTNRTAPKTLQAPSQTTARILPEAEATIAPTPTPTPTPTPPTPTLTPTPAPILAAAQIQPAPAPQEPNGQIWECTINGQKTFSDNPCGEKSSLHEIGPVNGMDPTPIFPRARSYAPESSYRPEYSYQGNQPQNSYQGDQEDSTAGEQQFANGSYPVFVGIPVHEHRRPDHEHRPHGHDRGPPPRKN